MLPVNLFPIFVKLHGRNCLVVGAESIAEPKINSLLESGARVTVVAPDATPRIRELSCADKVRWLARDFQTGDLDGIFLLIAATSAHAVNRAAFLEAQRRGILCNAVDDPPHCDFYYPAVVRRGDLQIAISTSGESPALAQRLRRELDASLGESVGDWLRQVGNARRQILATHPPSEERKKLLHQLACGDGSAIAPLDLPGASRLDEAGSKRGLGDLTSNTSNAVPPEAADAPGIVYLVGAGPGAPELLTIKAHALLRSADVVLHDDLVPAAITSLAGPHARVINVGKRCGRKKITQEQINAQMIEAAGGGLCVVRLKSGDPAIFGRLAEELDALDAAHIPHEIVPGITAGLAASAFLAASLTDRRKNARVVIISGHHAHGSERQETDWSGLARGDATLIIYMPGHDYAGLRDELLAAGLPADVPAAVVSRAATPEERQHRTTLGALVELPCVEAPSILLIGRALGRASREMESANVSLLLAEAAALLQPTEP